MASLWGGRFEKDMDDIVKKYNASIFFDQRMYNEDIDGSIAHVTMLGKQGIVSNEEKDQIIAGLEEIRKEIVEGKILFTVEDEDIHMGIESRLIDKIGDVGKKLHTSRSRNDQCQVDTERVVLEDIGITQTEFDCFFTCFHQLSSSSGASGRKLNGRNPSLPAFRIPCTAPHNAAVPSPSHLFQDRP